ncbi:hypothetical protein BHE74_00014376 [Ensete ventricosum]|nr:hypothetical protein BHE74_00014376 [Ensete ventricosum]
MACKGFWECLLKLLNVILTLAGLAMVGYGVYLLVEWNKIASGSDGDDAASPTSSDSEFLKLGRPMLVAVSLSSSFLDYLPKAWYGILHFFCFPSPKEFLFILLELPFFALVFMLALIVRAVNRPVEYDSDEDDVCIAPRSTIRQPLMNRQGAPATGVPVLGTLDHRPSRNDAKFGNCVALCYICCGSNSSLCAFCFWKYGLDTSEFTYNPSDPSRYQQAIVPPAEERGHCTIL